MMFLEALQSSIILFILLILTYIPFAWLNRLTSNTHSFQAIDADTIWKTPFFPLFQAIKLLLQRNYSHNNKSIIKNIAPLIGLFFIILFFAGIPYTEFSSGFYQHLLPGASCFLLFSFYLFSSLAILLSGLASENTLSKLDGIQLFVIRMACLLVIFIHILVFHYLSGNLLISSVLKLQTKSYMTLPSLGLILNPIGFLICLFSFALLFKRGDHGRHDQNRDLLDHYRSTSTGANLLAHLIYENWDKLAAASILCLYFLRGASLFGFQKEFLQANSQSFWVFLLEISVFFVKALAISYLIIVIQKSLATLRYQQILIYIWAALLPLSFFSLWLTIKVIAPLFIG